MSSTPLSVAVLVSEGRHSVSGAPRACRGDAIALALAAKLGGGSHRCLHAGDASSPALQDYLAYGAKRLEVVAVDEGHDAVAALGAALHGVDVILTGLRAEQGDRSGLMPYLLAHALGRPVIGDVLDVTMLNGEVRVRQFQPKGKRRAITAPHPLVLAVHPLANFELSYAHVRRISGRIVRAGPDIGAAIPCEFIARTVMANSGAAPAPRTPLPLKADANLDGHARMQSYIQSPARGGAVVFDGSPVDKAQILLTYLRDHRLVDF